ncbi:MAG: hypothetical protein GXW96_05735 [Christensenellaceae bacterium]|nr:hypothetical protein [Christensenellaceae bacterium]
MIKAARNGWTDKQIIDALHAVNGSQCIQFRFDVLRNGVRRMSIAAEGSVSLNRFADIQRTARFTLNTELDWLRDEIKPYMLLRMDADRFAEFPLGVFVLSTPIRKSKNGVVTYEVEAYDRTVILAEDSLVEPLYIAAGEPYLDAVQSVLAGAGITQVLITDYVDTALPIEREFEIGTRKLSVVNTLLSEINFNPIYCDADGRFVISKYKEPSIRDVEYTYAADEMSIIARDTESDMDYFNVPNVFIAMCSNPDLEQDFVSVYVNDNPASKFSTVQRGRNITSEIYRPDAIASQEDLDAYIRRIAFEANQVYEPITFHTALNPLHDRADVLMLKHPDVQGVFVESSWTIPLKAGGRMAHQARRLVKL